MIAVVLNEANFEYDIHSLVKAFYPEEDVLVRAVAIESEEDCGDPLPDSSQSFLGAVLRQESFRKELQQKGCETAPLVISVFYDREQFSFSFYQEVVFFSDAKACDAVCSSHEPTGQEEGCRRMSHPSPVLHRMIAVNASDRKDTKNRLKKTLYDMLSDFSGQTLPWGTLTGIRPTKIPMAMMEEGCSDADIRRHMKETYFASDEKIALSIEVAGREKELLVQIDYAKGYSLYVGIPFCPTTCLYCSFASYPIEKWQHRVEEYLDALEKEIIFTANVCRDKVLNSVYIGGGTPISLTVQQLERLIVMIGEYFGLFDAQRRIVYKPGMEPGFQTAATMPCGEMPQGEQSRNLESHLLEFTVEAGRPDSITKEKLEVLKAHNISRISINPQTMKEETLRLIGRAHTVDQTRESFYLARELGFDNINMDLIVGLPGESLDDVRRTMEALVTLRPDNVTVHSLAIKRAARLRMERDCYEQLGMENTWETIALTAAYCRQMGLSPYYLYRQKNMAGNFENVGYAAPGKAGVYNILIMEEKQTIMALGAGATTKLVSADGSRIERVANVKDITHYLARVDEMIERKRRLMTWL